MDFMTHVQSNTGEHVIWGSFETNPYHGTLYLSRGSTVFADSKEASMYVWSRHNEINQSMEEFPLIDIMTLTLHL